VIGRWLGWAFLTLALAMAAYDVWVFLDTGAIALLELGRDVRPPDYAATYARQAATLSGLDTAIAVVAVARPPWLEAVADEPGVRVVPRAACTEPFATV